MGGSYSGTDSPRRRRGGQGDMWYTYIIRSLKDGRYYIGYTADVRRRLMTHNAGGNVSTRNRKPFVLVYFEEYSTRNKAMRRERQIKNYKGGEAFKKLINKDSGRFV